MFGFTSLKSIQLEITNRCQASCPMCARNIHGGITNPSLTLTDWSLDDFKTIINEEVLNQISSIGFCGEYGDATLNLHLSDMCQYASDTSPDINISIQTNGSTRNEKWWTELVTALPKNHVVVFALDGLADTHHLHRQGTDFNKIIKNATAFIQAGGIAEWQFICFKHNEHQLDEARALATSLGFKNFKFMYSNRFEDNFPVVDKDGAVTHVIQQPSKHKVTPVTIMHLADYKKLKESTITCKSDVDKDILINSDFKMVPCCMLAYFLAPRPSRATYKQYGLEEHTSMADVTYTLRPIVLEVFEKWGGIASLDTKTYGIKHIINSELWQTVLPKEWDAHSSLSQPCAIACGNKSPYKNEVQSNNTPT